MTYFALVLTFDPHTTMALDAGAEAEGSFSFPDQFLFLIIFFVMVLLCITLTFVASSILLRLSHTRRDRHYRNLEKQWRPLLMGILLEERRPAALVRTIEPRDYYYFCEFLYQAAKRFMGAEREAIAALAGPFLKEGLRRISQGSAESRAHAIQVFSLLGLEQCADRIIAALDDKSLLIAMTAARALAYGKQGRYAEAILARLHRFGSWDRNFLASLLASSGLEAAPALRAGLADKQQAIRIRAIAAEALGKLNDLASADAAVRILAEETEQTELVSSALRLLAEVGRTENLEAVWPLLKSPHFFIRAYAVSTMGRLGDTTILPLIRHAFEDPSPWVAFHAAQGIKNIGGIYMLKSLAASRHPRADIARQVLLEVR